jgi:hypothetical protein
LYQTISVSFFLTRAGHPFLSRFKKNGKDFGAPKSLPFFLKRDKKG